MINMIEHFANRGDYMALFFIFACVFRVLFLIVQLLTKGKNNA